MSSSQKIALKVATVLWIIWGIVHALAGTSIIAGDTISGFQAIGDAVEPAELKANYHPAVGAVLNQHAWNLLWFGVVTMIGAVFIWKGAVNTIWMTAIVGGLADPGGYAKFFPGTVMTIVSATVIILSFWVWLSGARSRQTYETIDQ
ncbi:MAG: hypothetical protein AAGA73_07795 [Pseudomonadota bacterium]